MSKRRAKPRGRAKPSITLGLDIDTSSLRAVLVQHENQQSTLIDTFTADSDPAWFDDAGTVVEPKALGAALKAFLKVIGQKPSTIHVSAANQPTLLRVLTPPAGVPQNEIKSAIQQLILSQLPVTEDTAEIRYSHTGERILAGTVSKPHAQALMTTLQAAGIKPTTIEPRGISALRATTTPTDKPDLLLLINDDSAIITIRKGQTLQHNRVIGTGAQHLNAEPENASRALISDMLDMADSITNDTPDFTVTVAGENADHATLTQMLTKTFNRDLHAPTFPWPEPTSDYIASVGLALKQDTTFDFKPLRTRSSSTRTKSKAGTKPRSNIGVFLLAPIAAAGLFLYYNSLNSELDTLYEEISMYRSQGLEYADISQRYDALLARQDRLNNTLVATERITGERVSAANLVERLIDRVTQPENGSPQAYLTSLSISPPTSQSPRASTSIPGTQQHGVTISGVTRDTDTLSRIVEAFETDSTIEALFDRATLNSGNYSYTLQLLTTTHPDQESIAAAQIARQAQEELEEANRERAAASAPAESNSDVVVPIAPPAAGEEEGPQEATEEEAQPAEMNDSLDSESEAEESAQDTNATPAPAPAAEPTSEPVPVSTFNEDTQ